jgi:hypothetical protein
MAIKCAGRNGSSASWHGLRRSRDLNEYFTRQVRQLLQHDEVHVLGQIPELS